MKISIITINYNNLDGLKRTIDSVVAQTYKDFEWIIIDGGSTDGSRELIEQYVDHISYWVSEPDKGIYNAMNKGILVAKGDYLLFLNSGDWLIDSDVIEKAMNIDFTASFVYGILRINEGGRIHDMDVPVEKVNGLYLLESTLPHQATFIRRDMFEKYGLYDESYRICSDWKLFMIAIMRGGETVQKLPFVVSFFIADGISYKNPEATKKECLDVINNTWSSCMLTDYKNYKELKNAYNNEFLVLARMVFNTNRYFRFIIRLFMRGLINLDRFVKCNR